MSPRITSPANARIKAVVGLRRRRARERAELFLIEGERPLRLALEAGIKIADAFLWVEGLTEAEGELLATLRERGAPVHEVSRNVAQKLSYGDRLSSLVVVARRPAPWLPRPEARALVVVLDGVEKPGNLGAVVRTAEAVGASAVLVTNTAIDLFSDNAIRASRGAVFTTPCAALTSPEAAAYLGDLPIVVATPEAETDFRAAGLRRPLALVLGQEHGGVSSFWRERANRGVCIPMQGRVDSLNVSVSAALLLYAVAAPAPPKG